MSLHIFQFTRREMRIRLQKSITCNVSSCLANLVTQLCKPYKRIDLGINTSFEMRSSLVIRRSEAETLGTEFKSVL